MSEPVSKQRPMIDLDEFERRLGRPVPPAKNSGDPLAELARLVGNTEDRFKNIFTAAPSAQERKPPELGWPARKNAPQPQPQPEPPPLAEDARQRINLGGDFAAIEAGLLGTITPEAETPIASAQKAAPAPAHEASAPAYLDEDDVDHWLDAPYAPQAAAAPRPVPEPPRSRLPLYATAAIILVGIAGIGGTFALKRTPKGPHEIATIKALAGPTKVQASAATDGGKNDDASILDKSPEPKPTATVNRAEQPVDLAATQPTAPSPPPEPTPTSAQETPTPQPSVTSPQDSSQAPSPQATQSSSVDTAAEVPVPPPPAAASMPGPAFGLAGMIEPKKVRTVAVRPDGTLVSNDASSSPVSSISPPIPTQAPPQQAPEQQAPPPTVPGPSSDAAQAPAKTTARVEQPSQQPSDNGGAPSAPPAASSSPSDNASPPDRAAKTTDTKPSEVAEAESETSNAGNAQHAGSRAGGVFSVQLAAAPTEDEARQSLNRLQSQYGSVLKGHRLKYRGAKVADKRVFRVRVSGLSREQATALCQKLQAKGGSCFVAKN